jgi:hypothetical protein
MPLDVANESECRLGDAGLEVVGDTNADRLGGEPGGVKRGVLVWDANRRPCDMRGLEPARIELKCSVAGFRIHQQYDIWPAYILYALTRARHLFQPPKQINSDNKIYSHIIT